MRRFATPLALVVCTLAALLGVEPVRLSAQGPEAPVFRSSVDLVSMSAVVRDKRGRVVRSLTEGEFEVLDAGKRRPLLDFQWDASAPVSVALLVDGSGSMHAYANASRQIAQLLLARLRPQYDEASLMSFDTRLLTLCSFTGEFEWIRAGLHQVETFGASSVYDAIAGTAGTMAGRVGRRRAVVVITDGTDNASTYTPDAVAGIASAIDVPVYVVATTFPVGGEENAADSSTLQRSVPLAALARATGGEYLTASTPAARQAAVGRIVDDLRHQYVFAFEPSPFNGLRRIEVRTRDTSFRVQARRWYAAAEYGQ